MLSLLADVAPEPRSVVTASAFLAPFLFGLVLGLAAGIGGTIAVFRANRQPPCPVQSATTPAVGGDGTPLLDQILSVSITAPAPNPAASRLSDLRQRLRVKFLHDENKVNDAIEFERNREPSAGEEEWLRAANERWERENR